MYINCLFNQHQDYRFIRTGQFISGPSAGQWFNCYKYLFERHNNKSQSTRRRRLCWKDFLMKTEVQCLSLTRRRECPWMCPSVSNWICWWRACLESREYSTHVTVMGVCSKPVRGPIRSLKCLFFDCWAAVNYVLYLYCALLCFRETGKIQEVVMPMIWFGEVRLKKKLHW